MYLIVMSIANGKSSKIYHILSAADLLKYRVLYLVRIILLHQHLLSWMLFYLLMLLRRRLFAARYYQSYSNMMLQVLNQLKK